MEWLTCLFVVNLMLGCFLFKMFKTLYEFCFLSNVINICKSKLNFVKVEQAKK